MNTHNLGMVVEGLRREVGILRSFLIGVAGKDKEGNYNPKFVEKILKTSQSDQQYTLREKVNFWDSLIHDNILWPPFPKFGKETAAPHTGKISR